MNANVFLIEPAEETLVVTPMVDLSELQFDRIQADADTVLKAFDEGPHKNLIIDLSRTGYYGSTALGFFLRLWKRVKTAGGEMVLCGVSENEREVLRVTRLDTVWPQRDNRDLALADIRAGSVRSAES